MVLKRNFNKSLLVRKVMTDVVWLIYDFLLRDKWEKLSVGSWKLMVCQTKIYYLLSKPFWGIKEAAEAR